MDRLRRAQKQARMRWKRWLSYRKKEWDFRDYPVAVRTQKVDPAWNHPHLQQHRYIANVQGWFLDAGGDTRREALRALREAFERRKTYMAEQGEPLPRPGTIMPLEFAPTDRIDRHGDIVNEIIEEILHISGAWVSDQTCLWELTLGEDIDEVYAQIRARFGVDVSDIPYGSLPGIVERIAGARNRQNSPIE